MSLTILIFFLKLFAQSCFYVTSKSKKKINVVYETKINFYGFHEYGTLFIWDHGINQSINNNATVGFMFFGIFLINKILKWVHRSFSWAYLNINIFWITWIQHGIHGVETSRWKQTDRKMFTEAHTYILRDSFCYLIGLTKL